MRVFQTHVLAAHEAPAALAGLASFGPQLVLAFGGAGWLRDTPLWAALGVAAPGAAVVGCTTAGEIAGRCVAEDSLVLTGLAFEATPVRVSTTLLGGMGDSAPAGARLGAGLAASVGGAPLRCVLLLGQGVGINGTALLRGLQGALPAGVPVVGGLAGDMGQFSETWIRAGLECDKALMVAVGLYGLRLRLSYAAEGGWQAFGPPRRVTRAAGNVLFELDGQPALEVYKRYLGPYADELPGSGLLFPFAVLDAGLAPTGIARTILGVDEAAGSLILAGEVADGGSLQLTSASTQALRAAAQAAAGRTQARQAPAFDTGAGPGLALLVSCVGRKLVMAGRTEEEVEAVAEALPPGSVIAGFYSNGEICPLHQGAGQSELHNQTMTISYFSEA